MSTTEATASPTPGATVTQDGAQTAGAATQATAPGLTPAATTPANATLPIGGADGQTPGFNYPKDLPDHLKGQTPEETITKLAKAYLGAREEVNKKAPPVPEAAADYKIEFGESIKGSIAEDDKAVSAFKEIAREHGYTQQQMDAIPKFFDKLIELKIVDAPVDMNALLVNLAPDGFRGTDEQKQQAGAARMTTASNWIKQLPETVTHEMKEEMRLLTTSKAGIAALEWVMKSGMNAGVQPGGQVPGAVSKADLDARIADPRNDFHNPRYNEDFAKETQALFKRMYG
jgi:hypothetical protein